MNLPKEVLVMLAAATNIEQIIDDINEASSEYKTACLIDSDEDKKIAIHKLTMHIHLFILQQMTKGNFEQAIKVINDMKDFQKKVEFFNTENN